jgi:DNA gyrase subunit A
VPGPDFPTGASIMGRSGIHSAYHTGRGSIVMRSKTHIEELRKEREAIIVTEVPYQVNKASMVEKIADLVREKRIEGISDLRDESSREGVRVVIEIKRDARGRCRAEPALSLHPLQTSFGANMVALTGGRPEVLNLKDFISAFVEFREEVVSGVRASCSTRPASAPMCSAASPPPSPISTRSSA